MFILRQDYEAQTKNEFVNIDDLVPKITSNEKSKDL